MSNGSISAKISVEKGCVSVVGLQRFPVSLYEGQWRTLAAAMPALIKFLDANKDNEHLVRAREGKVAKKPGGATLL